VKAGPKRKKHGRQNPSSTIALGITVVKYPDYKGHGARIERVASSPDGHHLFFLYSMG
jgi:hypothetical protein